MNFYRVHPNVVQIYLKIQLRRQELVLLCCVKKTLVNNCYKIYHKFNQHYVKGGIEPLNFYNRNEKHGQDKPFLKTFGKYEKMCQFFYCEGVVGNILKNAKSKFSDTEILSIRFTCNVSLINQHKSLNSQIYYFHSLGFWSTEVFKDISLIPFLLIGEKTFSDELLMMTKQRS